LSPGPTGPAKVFITYRRQETAAHAGRLYDAMVARFEDANVFMDVDMKPGVDFVEEITSAVAACHVLIVVMGPRWATVQDDEGRPRIADPEDFVRLEVETGLRRPDVTPIPVLVSGARMPDPEILPPEVRPITRRQALELSDHGWRYDVARLISTLDELLAERVPDAPEGSVDTQQVAPPGPKVPSRRGLWAGIGAAIVLAALAALAFALLRDGSDDLPDGSEGQWTRVEAGTSLDGSGQQEILALANLPEDGGVAVGRSGKAAAVWMFDGSSWSPDDVGGARGVMWDVVSAGDELIAVGSRGSDAAFWLRSGDAWQSASCDDGCGGPGQQRAYAAIARRDGSFVAVGNDSDADGKFDAAVWVSPDGGLSWERAADDDSDLAGANSQVMKDVVELDGQLVAVGRDVDDAAVWMSRDGSDWRPVTDPALGAPTRSLEMNSMAIAGTRIVAVGREEQGKRNSAAAWFVDQGSTWRRAGGDFALGGQQMRAVTAAPSELVAVGFDGKRAAAVWRSEDGETWSGISSSAFAGDLVEMNGVARMANGTLFGGGSEGEDAALWESSPP
jgi:hypothetical protein